MSRETPRGRVPLWFKIGFTIFVVVWIALYSRVVEKPQHFLWMCHVGNILIAAGLWLESPLLLSWQALSLLFADLIWSLDFFLGLTLGQTPLGSAWYMFHDKFSSLQKALSLFHLVMPVLMMWALWRFGYDRRAILLQAVMCWILFPITFLVSGPKDNINWVYGPFGKEQTTVPATTYLFLAMILYVIVLYLPSHLVLSLLVSRPRVQVLKNG